MGGPVITGRPGHVPRPAVPAAPTVAAPRPLTNDARLGAETANVVAACRPFVGDVDAVGTANNLPARPEETTVARAAPLACPPLVGP